MREKWFHFAWVAALVGCTSEQSSVAPCAPAVWEGECQLVSVTKVEEAEFPIPHVVMEAAYQPVANARDPAHTPAALTQRTMAKAALELALYDYLEGHPRVACRSETAQNTGCVAPRVTVSLPPFDAEAAERASTTPAVTGCAQIEATSAQDKLQGAHSTQTFISQRIGFAENSAQLPPDADALMAEVSRLLAAKPGIECLGIVGAIASGEPPRLAEQRAKAVRDLLMAHGVAPTRLLTIGATAKVFGNGSRPAEGDPADRRVGFSVLLERTPHP